MKTTMRTAAAAGVLAILLSACGGSPTSSAPVEPAGPSYDGGFTVGSGNREAPADSTAGSSTNATGQEDRDGYTIGSGN